MNLKNLFVFLLFASAIAFVGCGDDDNSEDCTKTCDDGFILDINCECVEINTSNEVLVTDNITGEVTWTSDKIWILTTRVAVEDGGKLTIEPGTIVKGEAGTGANATALLVARGGMLMAEGTAANPIIFTSVADEIQPKQIVSPNLEPGLNGLWGGLIVCGKAPISAKGGEESTQIEGIPASDTNGLYGGTVNDDNSGVIKYVSVRHGGANIGEGNEINGITLGGVGNGTTIENVEVVSNQDDGIECFGGSVNITNALVWGQGDDAYDMDQAYTGTVDNFIYIGGKDSDHGLELDGPEGARLGSFTLKNGTLKGYNKNGKDGGEYADLRDGVTCDIENCYFFNFSEDSDFEFDNNEVTEKYIGGMINLKALQFNVSHLEDGNKDIASIIIEKTGDGENKLDAFTQRALDGSVEVVANGTVGADAAQFSGWSLAAQKDQLSDF